MSDRHICKAKRTDNGEWVEGYFVEQNYPEYHAYIIKSINIEMDSRHIDILEHDIIEVDHETVCQCTGLTDKNGKKIWENDIVHIPYERLEDSICKVIYRRGMFIGELADGCEDSIIRSDLEVIGNIFDSPELLEEN